MKVDETTLQNILKAYGKKMKPRKNTLEVPKQDQTENESAPTKKLESAELDIINYDKEGKVAINPQQKEALIDFFQ
jgi:hypothetical protein